MENEKNVIEKIRKDYVVKETGKLDELKALNKKVKFVPTLVAYIVGVIASLILGTGMCLAMKVIGGSTALMVVGIVIGVIGIGLAIANYFVFGRVLNSRKAKYSEEILALSNELLNEEK